MMYEFRAYDTKGKLLDFYKTGFIISGKLLNTCTIFDFHWTNGRTGKMICEFLYPIITSLRNGRNKNQHKYIFKLAQIYHITQLNFDATYYNNQFDYYIIDEKNCHKSMDSWVRKNPNYITCKKGKYKVSVQIDQDISNKICRILLLQNCISTTNWKKMLEHLDYDNLKKMNII